jgi:hypothetical protein
MPTPTYLDMARHARQQPQEVDFAVLRQLYIDSQLYRPNTHFTQSKLMGQTNSAGSFAEVAAMCEQMLDGNPMDLEVWIMLDFVYHRLEDKEKADLTGLFVQRMLEAIRASGDGQSIETAWQLIAFAEEYTFLNTMGLKVIEHEVIEKKGRFYDVVECIPNQDSNAEPRRFYFDITAPQRFLLDSLE